MEDNSKIKTDNNQPPIEEQEVGKIEDVESTDTKTDGRDEATAKKIASKISDLRELQHMIDPHKKFELIEGWMGEIEDFQLYQGATEKEVREILELMENLREFVLEYSKVLYAEKKKTSNIETYIK